MPIAENILIAFAGCTPCECGVISACAAESFDAIISWIVQWALAPAVILLLAFTLFRKYSAKAKNIHATKRLKYTLFAFIILLMLIGSFLYLQHQKEQQNLSKRKQELLHDLDACAYHRLTSEQDRMLCNEIHLDRTR